MKLDGLVEGRLIKRYKRFLADIELADGSVLTAHCPNTGSMTRCAQPNSRVWLLHSDNPKRKYAYTWELVEVDDQYLCCVNTHRANALVAEALEHKVITELSAYDTVRREVPYHDKARIDFLLSSSDSALADAYVEVKSLTYLLPANEQTPLGMGVFPDAVTTRGAKHLEALMAMKAKGYRAVLLFCVPHTGIKVAGVADMVDPKYGQLLRQAQAQGVELMAYGAAISAQEIRLESALPLQL